MQFGQASLGDKRRLSLFIVSLVMVVELRPEIRDGAFIPLRSFPPFLIIKAILYTHGRSYLMISNDNL